MSTDQHLVQRISHRDEEALMLLYERYGRLVKGMAHRVLRDDPMAEEITQDVFLKLWRQPERWDPALGGLGTWLMAVTRNAAVDRLRAEKRRPVYASVTTEYAAEELADSAVSDEPGWHDGLVLHRLLANLPAEQRQLVELAFFQGMTHSELAGELGLPLGTVKTRLRRGLQRLRDLWLHAE